MPRMPPSDIHLQSPRQWSPISYAFLGDAVWELYIRRLFFAPPAKPLEYDLKCKKAVKAEAQDTVLRHLVEANFFSGELCSFHPAWIREMDCPWVLSDGFSVVVLRLFAD